MKRSEAERIIGNQPRWVVRNMAQALCFHAWRNTSEEWRRLEAATLMLGKGAPKAARKILKARRERLQ
jgi:hypothetical protein